MTLNLFSSKKLLNSEFIDSFNKFGGHERISYIQFILLRNTLTPSLKVAGRHVSSLCEPKVCQEGSISVFNFRWPLPFRLKKIIKSRLHKYRVVRFT
jgi:hypothetical protein